MSLEDLNTFIQSIEPAAEVVQGKQFPEVMVPDDRLHQLALELKENPSTAMDYLICLTGADFEDHMKVIYHLESTVHNTVLVLKTKTLSRINPVLPTVCDIWQTAEFHEREVFDLLGIRFKGHPDMRRLFLSEEWGFPLRKDYVDEVRIVDR
ncbi:MAG TPA: NADH-quinone oxidoreductase subunit C [Bacteroidales bacterium]|nr:NADH-quinone oxidoreductase subunit C [Bacteroidales bacterium]HRZ20394.1 NADH-quinone oxidoreductase subunit C [Bacteroidales bacterium]